MEIQGYKIEVFEDLETEHFEINIIKKEIKKIVGNVNIAPGSKITKIYIETELQDENSAIRSQVDHKIGQLTV